jgi:AhpD family alkylhydroperoxidase
MSGPSTWSVSERELMAGLVAKWNSCFCVGAHGAVAAKEIKRSAVDAASMTAAYTFSLSPMVSASRSTR